MRYSLILLATVLAGLVALPLSASAQTGEEHSLSFWHDEALKIALFSSSPAPSSETAPEEPALQLKLDDAGVQVAPGYAPRTPDGYTLEETELRVKRVRIALLSSTGVFVVGTALALAGYARAFPATEKYSPDAVMLAGLSLLGAGALGMLVSGGMLSSRARDLRRVRPLDPRARRARIALLSSTGVLLLGGMIAGLSPITSNGYERFAVLWAGVGVASAGSLGMLVSGPVLGARKRKLRRLRQTHYGTPRRVQWDLARSRLVF
jgi:hypothetical protein